MRRGELRSGVVLLEVLVALALLGAAGAALTALALEAGHAAEAARRADRQWRRASAFLDVVVLWPREDLDRRLGFRRQGEWVLVVQRTAPSLYGLAIRDSASRRELLQTTVYRPDTASARGPDAQR